MFQLFCRIYILLFFLMMCIGCSRVIQQREPDKNRHGDLGSETQVQIRGPGAGLIYRF